MPDHAPDSDQETEILRVIRDARFRNGVACPRCGDRRVIRWGVCQHRQRYRCHGCRRTFNDLTGTAAAYTKRLHLWPAYMSCMMPAYAVRKSARIIGVQPSTTFRWRHAVLDQVRRSEEITLSGLVEFAEASYRYSEKGARHGKKDRARERLNARPRGVSVVFARDRNGAVFSQMAPATQIRSMDLRDSIKPRLARASVILSMRGGLSAFGVLARVSSCTLRKAVPSARRSATLHHLGNVAAGARRFDEWMVRFHGVATRYLNNYLAWHRVVDEASQLNGGFRLMRWAL